MFSEIETVLESSSVQEIFDEVAAVKYIIWDKWVTTLFLQDRKIWIEMVWLEPNGLATMTKIRLP